LIHPDGNILTVVVVESLGSHSLGMPASRSRNSDEKAEAVATYTARGREEAAAAPRHASLIVSVDINCFRPGDPQYCAGSAALPSRAKGARRTCLGPGDPPASLRVRPWPKSPRSRHTSDPFS